MNPTPFAALSPDFVLDAIEALGFDPDGRLQALNSFENRVYQVGIEGGEPLIAKFYRPGRDARQQHVAGNQHAEFGAIQAHVFRGVAVADDGAPVVVADPQRPVGEQALVGGNDNLDSGAGSDYMDGGAGSDRYEFGRGYI